MNGPGHSAFMFGIGDPKRKAAEHDVELGYTGGDDGVWLSCACGWERLLGFTPTPEQAMELTADHRYRSAPLPAWEAGEAQLPAPARGWTPPESPR